MRVAAAGNGGYGRLGHNVQKDEFSPRQIETFTGRMPVDEASIVRPCALQSHHLRHSDMSTRHWAQPKACT